MARSPNARFKRCALQITSMESTVGRGVKRVGAVLALTVVVLVGLSAVVTVVPQTMLPFYLLGWVIVFVVMTLRHSEFGRVRHLASRPPFSSLFKAGEVFAIFVFGVVTFRGLMTGTPVLMAAGFVGVVAAFWDMTS